MSHCASVPITLRDSWKRKCASTPDPPPPPKNTEPCCGNAFRRATIYALDTLIGSRLLPCGSPANSWRLVSTIGVQRLSANPVDRVALQVRLRRSESFHIVAESPRVVLSLQDETLISQIAVDWPSFVDDNDSDDAPSDCYVVAELYCALLDSAADSTAAAAAPQKTNKPIRFAWRVECASNV